MAITLPHAAMSQLFDAPASNDLPPVPNYNVCPTTQVHTVTSEDRARRLRPMRWGFIPHWYDKPSAGPLLINARAETIAAKPAFREACRARRCLVIADGFYEWARTPGETPLPWWITRRDGAPMALGAVWQAWERNGTSLTTCAVVTTGANADMAAIHDRLPVIIETADQALWLGEEGHGAANLMRPIADGALTFQRVSTAVNSSRASGPDLIAAI